MTIRARVRAILLVFASFALIVAGVLWYTDRRIDVEMEQANTADQIQKGVYELFMTTRTYLSYGEEAARVQWEARFASLRSMVEDTIAHSQMESEHLSKIAESTRQMEELFHQLVATVERQRSAAGDEAALLRDVTERLATRLIGRGQVMSNHAVLFSLASHEELAGVKRNAVVLILASVLAALGVSGLLSLLMDRDIMTDLRELQRGTDTVTAGDLERRLAPSRTEEIGRLAAGFNAMTVRLQAVEREREAIIEKLVSSNRELEDFAFVASHDLQEPLRKIESFAQVLREDCAEKLDARARGYIDIMAASAARMRRLIRDVLAFSRAGTAEKPFGAVDLTKVMAIVQDNLSERIQERHALVVVHDLPTIHGDETQMIQLLQNLVGNGLKFNEGPDPRVEVFASENETVWTLCVRDNGIGMRPGEAETIFAPFKRLHNQQRFEGTGIGLAICRRIVTRHGGTIGVESELNKGSTFWFTLPKATHRGRGDAPEAATPPGKE